MNLWILSPRPELIEAPAPPNSPWDCGWDCAYAGDCANANDQGE